MTTRDAATASLRSAVRSMDRGRVAIAARALAPYATPAERGSFERSAARAAEPHTGHPVNALEWPVLDALGWRTADLEALPNR